MKAKVAENIESEYLMMKKIAEAISTPIVDARYNHIIYHYTDVAGLLGILRSEAIVLWFSRFDCLNDKNEGQDIVEQFKIVCGKLITDSELDKKLLKSIMECLPNNNAVISYDHKDTNIEPIKNNEDLFSRPPIAKIGTFETEVFTCCFSSRNDLLPMWNNYSNGNAYLGYSIGFDSSIFNSNERYAYNSEGSRLDGYGMIIAKVIYSDEEKTNILCERIKNIFDYANKNGLGIEDIKKYIILMLNSLRFIFKKAVFCHEEEIRIIFNRPKQRIEKELDERRMPRIEYRSKRGIIIPYIEVFMKNCDYGVESVTIGPLFERGTAMQTVKDFLDNRKYRVDVIESSVPIRY